MEAAHSGLCPGLSFGGCAWPQGSTHREGPARHPGQVSVPDPAPGPARIKPHPWLGNSIVSAPLSLGPAPYGPEPHPLPRPSRGPTETRRRPSIAAHQTPGLVPSWPVSIRSRPSPHSCPALTPGSVSLQAPDSDREGGTALCLGGSGRCAYPARAPLCVLAHRRQPQHADLGESCSATQTALRGPHRGSPKREPKLPALRLHTSTFFLCALSVLPSDLHPDGTSSVKLSIIPSGGPYPSPQGQGSFLEK